MADTELRVDAAERELVEELSQLVLERTAPEELLLFDDTAEQYFQDPERVLDPRRREEAVGFGLDMALLTPYVLATVTAAVKFIAATVSDTIREDARPRLVEAIRRLYRKDDRPVQAQGDVAALNASHRQRIYDIVRERAGSLGLSADQAELLAGSVVGTLLVER